MPTDTRSLEAPAGEAAGPRGPGRHRDILLSLKYSTIEACFSVPMLNLTMPNLPFAIAFAVAALGWSPWAVGLMAALPHWCNFMQPPVAWAMQRRLPLMHMMRFGFVLSALPWACVVLLPYLGPSRDIAFAILLTVATFANSIASVSWSASISELVPPRISGRFFGRRNLIFGFWTLLAVLAAGHLADAGHRALSTFVWIFAAAGAARLIGLLFLDRMKFPPSVTHLHPNPARWKDFSRALHDRNYMFLMGFIGLWGLSLNLGLPFYTVFLIESLHFTIGDVVILTTLASLGGLLTLKGWGALVDRFGNKPVLNVCALAWVGVALFSWSLAGPHWQRHLYLNYLLVGGTTAGFQLCQFNLMVKLVPIRPRAPYIAVFLAVTSLCTALGPLLGGLLLSWLPESLGTFLGQPIRHYHVLFALSLLGCGLSVQLLQGVREEAAAPAEAVWRTMRTMRAFNPLMGLTTVGELLLTPMGMVSLVRQSARSLRRQARVITRVGEEIVVSSQEVVRSSLGNRGPSEPPGPDD